jgi:glycosyltransferase involved in cell wall biosynthesis
MRVSFCIPCYDYRGKGSKAKQYLFEIFHALNQQTNKNFNVWISDHSESNHVLEACEEYSDLFEINYIKNDELRGNMSANTNSTLKNADGEILKIIFQDDFILTTNLVSELDKAFVDEVEWALTGFAHTVDDGRTHYNPKIPYYNDRLLEGVNTLSSPSVLAMKNGINEFFDEKLTMLMDCDLYYRLYKYHKEPAILNDYHISNREHKNQTQRLYEHLLSSELSYLKEKYNDRI